MAGHPSTGDLLRVGGSLARSQLSVSNQALLNLGMGTYDHYQLTQNGEAAYEAVGPVLSLMLFFGLVPRRVLINPTSDVDPFLLELTMGDTVIPDPKEYAPAPGGPPSKFEMIGLGPLDGVEIQFDAPGMPFYAPEIICRWKALLDDPSSNVMATAALSEKIGRDYVWYLPKTSMRSSPQDFPAFLSDLALDAADYVEAVILKFEHEAQLYADSFLYDIGLSGIVADPSYWLHLYRWMEEAPARRSRIEHMFTIGTLAWRSLTGPDPEGGDITGSVMSRRATDGPRKVAQFLREECLPVAIEEGVVTRPKVSLLTRMERGVAMQHDEIDLVGDTYASSWEIRDKSPQALVGALARKLAADHARMELYPDYEDAPAPPPDAPTILSGTYAEYIDLLVARDMLRYEGDSQLGPPGTNMEGIEVKSTELMQVLLDVQSFANMWEIDFVLAKAFLRDAASRLYWISDALVGLDFSHITDPEERTFKENLRANLTYQNTLDYAGPVTQAVDLCRAASEAAGDLAQHNLPRSVTPEEVYDVWLQMGVALVAADRFVHAARWTKDPSILMRHFFDGVSQELGPDFDETAKKLFEKNLYAMPVATLFPVVFLSGVVVGIGDYVLKTGKDLAGVINDPFGFAVKCREMVQTLMDAPTTALFEEFGKALGAWMKRESINLKSSTNPVSFLFRLGRILGPLIIEELLSMLFEAYVIAPVLSRLSVVLRGIIRWPGTSRYDDLVDALANDPNMVDVSVRGALTAPRVDLPAAEADRLFGDNFQPLYAHANEVNGPDAQYDTPPPQPVDSDEKVLIQRYERQRLQLEHLLPDQECDALDALFAAETGP